MITIDYRSRETVCQQIVDRLRFLILKGALEPESQLPSVAGLSVELSLNPNSVRRAYRLLEEEGFIHIEQGKGGCVLDRESLQRKQEEKVLQGFKELVLEGKKMKMPKEEFLAELEKSFGEETDDRDKRCE